LAPLLFSAEFQTGTQRLPPDHPGTQPGFTCHWSLVSVAFDDWLTGGPWQPGSPANSDGCHLRQTLLLHFRLSAHNDRPHVQPRIRLEFKNRSEAGKSFSPQRQIQARNRAGLPTTRA
jgi:hypothetical protein